VEDTAISFEEAAPDAEEFLNRIGRITGQFPWLVCELDGRVEGYAYASPFHARAAYRWDTEGSIYLNGGSHSRGVGSGLYRCLMELLELQGYRNFYGCVTMPNEKSLGMHRALGFTEVGRFPQTGYKFGRWREIAWLWKRLGDESIHQRSPAPSLRLDPAG
jgi:phosphinothricin acetyltransferase